jgi:hypothetical protein
VLLFADISQLVQLKYLSFGTTGCLAFKWKLIPEYVPEIGYVYLSVAMVTDR